MPDLEKLLGALPIGLFMFFGTYLAARRRKSVAASAAAEMPEVAARLGLTFRKPAHPGHIGAVRGEYRGYEVFVDPDERPRAVLYFTGAPSLILRTYEHEKRTPADMQRFDTGRGPVDGFFKERYASAAVAQEVMGRAGDLEAGIAALKRASDKIQHVSLTPERLECAFDYGRPNHVPASAVEGVLSALVAIADAATAKGGATTPDPGGALESSREE